MGGKRSKVVKKRDQKRGTPTKQSPKALPTRQSTKPKIKFGSLSQIQKQGRDNAYLMARDASMPKGSSFISDAVLEEPERERKMNQSKESSYKQFKGAIDEMLEHSDVVLQVLDARDPMACRNEMLEQKILQKGHKLIFVLNKIDLVPDKVVDAWTRYFSNLFPTVEFKAASTSGGTVAHIQAAASKVKEADRQNPYRAVGVNKLLAKIMDHQKTATVGLLGMPNMGKSSIINSLSRAQKQCKTGQQPGVTTETTRIKLRDSLAIYDTPGVCSVASAQLLAPKSLVLSNAVSGTNHDQNCAMVNLVLQKFNKEALRDHYDTPCEGQYRFVNHDHEYWANQDEFLAFVAMCKGLMAGPIPDKKAAAREIVQDVRKNALKWWEAPPELLKQVESENFMQRTAVVFGDDEDDSL